MIPTVKDVYRHDVGGELRVQRPFSLIQFPLFPYSASLLHAYTVYRERGTFSSWAKNFMHSKRKTECKLNGIQSRQAYRWISTVNGKNKIKNANNKKRSKKNNDAVASKRTLIFARYQAQAFLRKRISKENYIKEIYTKADMIIIALNIMKSYCWWYNIKHKK